jgi:hypothetical protein
MEWMLSASAILIIKRRLASKHDRFYEPLLAALDIQVQEDIASCTNSSDANEIEASLLNFGWLRRNLCLQNISDLSGPVFPESQGTPKSPGAKSSHGNGESPLAKIPVITNRNPHPSLALTSYSDWEKVRWFTSLIPKVGSVKVCGRFHCHQACSSKCEKLHRRLQPAMVAATEAWVAESN